jgi:hypothetical protein
VIILCQTDLAPAAWAVFDTIEEARAAEVRRGGRRCREACCHAHTICYVGPSADGFELHVERGLDPPVFPASLAAAFAAAYPNRRRHNGLPVASEEELMPKPKPDDEETTVTEHPDDELTEKMLADEREAGRLLYRLGVAYRVAYAARRVAELKANGASELEVAGAQMVAAALSAMDDDDE